MIRSDTQIDLTDDIIDDVNDLSLNIYLEDLLNKKKLPVKSDRVCY
jgi:hypothetical protein